MKSYLVEVDIGIVVDAESDEDAINKAQYILNSSNLMCDYAEFSYVEELDEL